MVTGVVLLIAVVQSKKGKARPVTEYRATCNESSYETRRISVGTSISVGRR